MTKEFDVHFIVNLSDFISGIEATCKEEAKQKALAMLNDSDYTFRQRLIDNLYTDIDRLEVVVSEVLEVGEDI